MGFGAIFQRLFGPGRPATPPPGVSGVPRFRPTGKGPYSANAGTGQVHNDAAFDEAELEGFLLGLPILTRSSWIQSAQWSAAAQTLDVEIGGKVYTIPSVDRAMALRFAHSTSKGIWWHANKSRWGG